MSSASRVVAHVVMYVEKITRWAHSFQLRSSPYSICLWCWGVRHCSYKLRSERFSSWCRHFFFPAQGHRWPLAVGPSVMSCGRVDRGCGRHTVSWGHHIGVAWYHKLLSWEMSNEVMLFSSLVLLTKTTDQGTSQCCYCRSLEFWCLFFHTKCSPSFENENQRCSEIKTNKQKSCAGLKGIGCVYGWFHDTRGNEKVMHLWLSSIELLFSCVKSSWNVAILDILKTLVMFLSQNSFWLLTCTVWHRPLAQAETKAHNIPASCGCRSPVHRPSGWCGSGHGSSLGYGAVETGKR